MTDLADRIEALSAKREKLADDVRYYSGNEKAGYAEIDELDAELAKLAVLAAAAIRALETRQGQDAHALAHNAR